MKLIKKLFLIVLPMMFAVGCSTTNIDSSNSLSKQAIQQNTMTKVQNDVNVIMGKSYDYVLNNMGAPYVSVYSIKINGFEKLSDLDKIKDINQIEIISNGLLYPKYTSDHRLDGSAMYIVLENNEVNKVETCDFKNFYKYHTHREGEDVSIFVYSKYDNVDLSGLDNEDLEKYVGKNEKSVSDILENKQCMYSMILADDENIELDIYNIDNNKHLVVVLEDEKITNIETYDKLDLEYLSKKIN